MVIKSMRDFVEICEAEGELKRIKVEVDWDLELSHISKLNEEKGGPALLFENVKGCQGSVLTGAFTSTKRMAITLGMPYDYSLPDIAKAWTTLTAKEIIPSKEVKTGPIMENVLEGDDIDLTKFPAPRFYPLDGGRFIGTAVVRVERDPDTGAVNLGTTRMQLFDERSIGQDMVPGKRGAMILGKYKKLGKPMPCAAVIGCDPLFLMAGASGVRAENEFDVISTIRGVPVELVTSEVTGLPIPAEAELVIEGEMDADSRKEEGPFGEYTGYYTGMDKPAKPFIAVKRVLYRNNPILWAMSSAGRPTIDIHMLFSFLRTGTIWRELMDMKIPGIQSVFCPPQSTGRFWVIVSVKQAYPGHANQVASAVISTSTGHYGVKGVIVVDDDVAAHDLDRVWWALSVRYEPWRGTEVIKRGRATPIDPAPREHELITSKILIDATMPFETRVKPVEVKLDEEMVKKVRSRWKEYGLD